jgi:WD40 repeat protein
VILLAVALLAGLVALIQRNHARAHALTSDAERVGAEAVTQPRLDLAMLLAREAVNLYRSPQTEGSLLATLQRSPAVIGTLALPSNGPPQQQLAVSPDGNTLVVAATTLSQLAPLHAGSSVGELLLYDARTRQLKDQPLTDFAGALPPVYSTDGRLLAYPSGVSPPLIAVRDTRTLRLIHKLTLDPLQLASSIPDLARARIMITPDDRTIYCAYQEFSPNYNPGATYVARWSLPSGQLQSSTPIDSAAVLAVGLTNGGTRLAVVDSHTITIWDANSMRRLSRAVITPAPTAPSAAAISPDGHTITIATHTGAVTFVDAATGRASRARGPNTGPVVSLVYSPADQAIASATNNTVIIWNPRSATPAQVIDVPGGLIQQATISRQGDTLYTTTIAGLVLSWDLTGKHSFGRHFVFSAKPPCCQPVAPLAPPLGLSPDGETFAVRLGNATVGLFSTRTLQRQSSFSVKPASAHITALAWSPVAPELAVAGSSGLLQLWQTDGAPHLARSLTGLQPVSGQPEAVQAMAFSPDGRLIAASDSSETAGGLSSFFSGNPQTFTTDHPYDRLSSLAIWRTSSGRLIRPPKDLGTGSSPFDPLAFSPHGGLLAVSTPDGHDLVIDTTTGQTRDVLAPIGGDFTSALAFAPDGTLATGTLSGIVELWNPTRGARIGAPLPVSAGPVSSIAFDPHGQRLVTASSQDGAIKLFATATLQQEGTTLNTDQPVASSASFASDGSSLVVVNSNGNGFSWPMSLTAWEQRACAIAGRNLTPSEWSRYLPGEPYKRSCP